MPSRTRSHVLETLAENKLRIALGDRWIVRPKEKDYGVDFEAELLTVDGSGGTGNVLYIQSKATDAPPPRGNRCRLKVDRLRYLLSFEVPSVIVRYVAPQDALYWMWAFEAEALVVPNTDTVTLTFSDMHRWTQDTAAEIERTLAVLKTLKRTERTTSFPVRKGMSDDPLALTRLIHKLRDSVPFATEGPKAVPIQASLRDGALELSIERIATIDAPVVVGDPASLAASGLYLLAALLETVDHSYHASVIARECLRRRLICADDRSITNASISLIRSGDPKSAVELAMLNGLHDNQGFGHSIFRMILQSPMMQSNGMEAAVDDFYHAAIDAHVKRGEQVGAIRYSFANNLRNQGRYRKALRFYNTARKDEPKYLERPYFFNEVGGLLFFSGRYRASARAYHRSFVLDPDLRTAFCLADALLYSGEFAGALRFFEPAAALDNATGSEARLKIILAGWASEAGVTSLAEPMKLWHIRAEALSRSDTFEALLAQLAICFSLDDNQECWGEAIGLSIALGNDPMIADVLRMTIHKTGLEGFIHFKKSNAEILGELTNLVAELEALAVSISEGMEDARSLDPQS